MELRIKKDAAQALLDYLQTKPFGEVFQLVNILTSLTPIVPEQPKPAEPVVEAKVEEPKVEKKK